ncbi:MAG: hypothetical protein CVV21_00320 [Candidatus Goldiibacteriota bacterium HGW-Goldbacteria-1]|jgi:MFS family permease|nr:MAG: hypothetical protein CVV21_00320 [Candidatus Goldiibacteriota bacterium HGW-Goldbacteria-1]
MKKLESNIPKMYVLRFFLSFWLIVPVMVPFYKECGLSAAQVLIVQAIFSIAMLLFEIPTGYFADAFGRRKAIITASFLLPAGLLVYSLTSSFLMFCLAEILIAAAFALRSGTDSAVVYDTLLNLGREKEYMKIDGRAGLSERVGDALASVLGGLLSAVSLRFPFIVNIFTSAAMIPVAFSIKEPNDITSGKTDHAKEVKKAVLYSITHPEIRALSVLFAVVLGLGVVGIWTYFFFYKQHGITTVWFGILHAVFGLASGLGSFVAHKLEKSAGKKVSLYFLIFPGISFLVMAYADLVVSLPFIMANGFFLGYGITIIITYINDLTESSIRATVLSVAGMAKGLLFSLAAVLTGYIMDLYTLGCAHLFLGISYIIIFIFVILELHKRKVI